MVIPDNMKPEGSDNFFQYAAPIVFGMISDKNKTAKVRIIDATVRLSSPQNRDTSAPTQTAPNVCAIVFKVKIAVRGLTESSSFNRDHLTPFLSPVLFIMLTCDIDIDNSTASSIEQRNETPSASDP